MKVEIFFGRYYGELERKVNDFIKNRTIIDIKFSPVSNLGDVNFYAMIIYKEDKSE